MTPLDPRAADKLAKLCGMFGSDQTGERASAALMADRLVKERGLTWFEVISSPTRTDVAEKISFAFANIGALSMWEQEFIHSIRGKTRLSAKQLAILHEIMAKANTRAESE